MRRYSIRFSRLKTTTTVRIAQTDATVFSFNPFCTASMPVLPQLPQGPNPLRKPTFRDRAFQTYFRMRRPATLGVRGVVVNEKGEVLLLKHTYTPGWHFPGGGVERRETCALSLSRELEEEAGIIAAPESLELISVHANHAYFPNDHILVYRVPTWTQGESTQKGEIAEVRFFDPLAPPTDISKGTQRRLDEIFGGKPRSEHW
jgi:8-oxo-dGTP pyrophosphatase MutT (NUDIX family)